MTLAPPALWMRIAVLGLSHGTDERLGTIGLVQCHDGLPTPPVALCETGEGLWIQRCFRPDPPDGVIAAQTSRNKNAVLLLAEYADCAYRVIGKQSTYC